MSFTLLCYSNSSFQDWLPKTREPSLLYLSMAEERRIDSCLYQGMSPSIELILPILFDDNYDIIHLSRHIQLRLYISLLKTECDTVCVYIYIYIYILYIKQIHTYRFLQKKVISFHNLINSCSQDLKF